MQNVYKSEAFVKAEYLIDFVKKIDDYKIAEYKVLLNQYDELAKLLKNPTNMPVVSQFSHSDIVKAFGVDVLNENARKKIAEILAFCQQYVEKNKPIPPINNVISGWNPSLVIPIAIALCGGCFSVGYYQGSNSEKNGQFEKVQNLQQENQSLNKELNNLKNENIRLFDSLNKQDEQIYQLNGVVQELASKENTLLNLKSEKMTLDSLLIVQNGKIDSLNRKIKDLNKQNDGLYSIYKLASDSLQICKKRFK